MKRGVDIDKYLLPLDQKAVQCYLSDEIQVADLIEWIIGQIGRCQIWQTSFSISEEFLRRLFFIEKKKEVEDFTLILDLKATQKTLRLWVFMKEVMSKCYLAANHSKVLLFRGLDGAVVTVITSQNLTRGNRFESALVTTEQHVFDTMFAYIQDVINNHSVPFHDIYRATTGRD